MYRVVAEGLAKIRVNHDVFYNPKMQGLRNISVSFLSAVGSSGRSLLDATAASGIRAIRYKKECDVGHITALDINRKAHSMCASNMKLNKVGAIALNTSIQEYTNATDQRFDIIDLDPFGSPAPYIFDIMKVCGNGTLLMVTATDTAVLCGAHSDACMKQYGSRPLHNELCKEAGLRILYSYIARVAAGFNFGMVPLLGISDMHYMRAFVRLESGALAAARSAKTNGIGGFCVKCGGFELWSGIGRLCGQTCQNCRSDMEGFGPIWTGKLYDRQLLGKMAEQSNEGIVRIVDDELDTPMFYSMPAMTRRMRKGSVSHYKIIERLRQKGFSATRTQFDSDGVKTNAPVSEVSKAIGT